MKLDEDQLLEVIENISILHTWNQNIGITLEISPKCSDELLCEIPQKSFTPIDLI